MYTRSAPVNSLSMTSGSAALLLQLPYLLRNGHPLPLRQSGQSMLYCRNEQIVPVLFLQTELPAASVPVQITGVAICRGLFTHSVFLAPGLDLLTAVAALRDPSCPQRQFVLTVDGLQILAHENTPVSRILHASRVYFPLIYGSIVSYLLTHGKSLLGFTLTFNHPKMHR